MELTALYQRVIGLDVHQAKITACAIVEHNDGEIEIIEREFGAFKRDRRALAEWARELAPERVVMESTGTYWKSPYFYFVIFPTPAGGKQPRRPVFVGVVHE